MLKTAEVHPSDIQSKAVASEPLSFAPRPAPGNGEVLVQGILGAVRHRLLSEMIDHVEEMYKILICDRTGAEILNSCFRMHELMEHDIIVVEDLAVARQPVLSSPAMYFLSPNNEEGITHMVEDWSSRPRYKQPHVFWTSRVSDEVLVRLAEERVFTKRIATMKDMMLDFNCKETLLFHLNTKIDLWRLFPAVGKPLWLDDENHETAVSKMVEVMHTLNSGMPIIRYQQSSTPARDFSTQLIAEIKRLSSCTALSPGCLHRPLLIVVDRCCDFFEGLVHHRTYQCLSDEICPVKNGVYEQTYQGRKGEELKRTMMIDERDEYWCRFRHESFDRCLRVFQDELKALLSANPSLAHGAQKGVGLAAAGSAMRALPEFLDRQAKLSTHIDICTAITQQYAKQQLQAVVDLELDVLLHRRNTKDLLKQVKMVGGDLSVPTALRVRVLTLCFAFLSEKDLPHDQRLHMISTCGLQEEMMPVLGGLPLVSERMSKEQLDKLGRNYQSAGDGDAVGDGGVNGSAGKGLLNYPSYAKTILTSALQDTLNRSEFPFVNDEASSAAQQYMKKGGGKAAAQHASLRLHAGRAKAATGSGNSGKESPPLLDLGHEGKYVLKAPQKVILFVLGGVTSGEARAAYELAKEFGREVLIGGSHMLDVKEFMEEVKLCGTDGTVKPAVVPPTGPISTSSSPSPNASTTEEKK